MYLLRVAPTLRWPPSRELDKGSILIIPADSEVNVPEFQQHRQNGQRVTLLKSYGYPEHRRADGSQRK